MTNPARQAAERIVECDYDLIANSTIEADTVALEKIIQSAIDAATAELTKGFAETLKDLRDEWTKDINRLYDEQDKLTRERDEAQSQLAEVHIAGCAVLAEVMKERDEAREAARWLQGIWLSQQAMPDKQAELYAESTWKWLKESP